jgi:Raf kinase inhibitor-like YbhB/YbcL family protein
VSKIVIIIIIAAAVISAIAILNINSKPSAEIPQIATNNMIISSPSFKNGDYIPKKFSCEGENINPELLIDNVPAGAKSLALIMRDPDAPISGGFTHWLVWNIDSGTSVIKEESVPPGSVEGKNDAKRAGYTGPCPPPGHGIHHYHFTIYALSAILNLNPDVDKKSLESEVGKYLLAEADLVGLYQRK